METPHIGNDITRIAIGIASIAAGIYIGLRLYFGDPDMLFGNGDDSIPPGQ
jgi:hypothetical protein